MNKEVASVIGNLGYLALVFTACQCFWHSETEPHIVKPGKHGNKRTSSQVCLLCAHEVIRLVSQIHGKDCSFQAALSRKTLIGAMRHLKKPHAVRDQFHESLQMSNSVSIE